MPKSSFSLKLSILEFYAKQIVFGTHTPKARAASVRSPRQLKAVAFLPSREREKEKRQGGKEHSSASTTHQALCSLLEEVLCPLQAPLPIRGWPESLSQRVRKQRSYTSALKLQPCKFKAWACSWRVPGAAEIDYTWADKAGESSRHFASQKKNNIHGNGCKSRTPSEHPNH